MCKSFFDPGWQDLAALGMYGRWAGVNWVWSVGLTIFHAFFSIAIPVLLVNLIFPQATRREWIGRKTFKVLSVLWVCNGLFIFCFISAYRPPVLHLLITFGLVVGLLWLGRQLPNEKAASDKGKKCHPFWLWLAGLLSAIAFFVLLWGSSNFGIHPLLCMFLMAALVGLVVFAISKGSNTIALSRKHQLALAGGALSLFILIAPIQEFDKNRTDNTAGMTLVGIATIIFLVWLGRKVKLISEYCSE